MKKVLRMCVVCRQMKDKSELIRLNKTKDGLVCIDLTGKIDGRGAYICKDGDCIEKLDKNKAFNRAYKSQVSEEVYKSLKELKEN